MATTRADAPTTQGPEIGSDEWVERTLQAVPRQADDADDGNEAVTAQGDTPEAADNAAGSNAEPVAAAQWRQAAIPANDETVPQHFRGRSAGDVWDSYRELERTWNKDREEKRILEAKLAAKDTVREFLAEQRTVATPPTPTDEYSSLGIDIDTAPILNPREFHSKHDEMLMEKFKRLMADERSKEEADAQKKAEEDAQVNRLAASLRYVEQSRGLSEETMKARLPSVMMTAAQRLGQNGMYDKEQLLRVHDEIFGYTAPVAIPAQQEVPNPPGVKRPSVVEPTPTGGGPQLKQYEREILDQTAEDILSNNPALQGKFDMDRLRARYAANLRRARG
jgi:hypothetical protein